MCPPLGHSGARIGPALLMEHKGGRAEKSASSRDKAVKRRLEMGDIESWKNQSRASVSNGMHNRQESESESKCQTTLCARWRAFDKAGCSGTSGPSWLSPVSYSTRIHLRP